MIVNRLLGFFGRRHLRLSQENAASRREIEQRRHTAALYASLHGADLNPGANCDTELHHKFVALENDYRALEKEVSALRIQNLLLERDNRGLRDRLLGWARLTPGPQVRP